MSCAHSVARSVARSAARPANARWGGYPAALWLLWSSEKWAVALKGSKPAYTGTPTVTADGVEPGYGPSFTSEVVYDDGGTRVMVFKMDTASAGITTAREFGGGFWATSAGLEFRGGTNTASVATSWGVWDVVTAVVQVTDDGLMRIARGE